MDEKKNFKSTCGKGFHMSFANGWTISVQWGMSNYCDNRSMSKNAIREFAARTASQSCDNAEIAMWDSNGRDYDFGNDKVKGWVTSDEVAEWINKCKNF